MTQERLLTYAYDELLRRWDVEYQRHKRGEEEGYKTPIADFWLSVYDKDLEEIRELRKRA